MDINWVSITHIQLGEYWNLSCMQQIYGIFNLLDQLALLERASCFMLIYQAYTPKHMPFRNKVY